MAVSNQKLKLLYLKDYLEKNSDANHIVKMSQIIEYLDSNGIKAERKSIYSDIETLKEYGVDIEIGNDGSTKGYYVASRLFETAEIKLLIDAVQCSRFITHKRSTKIIDSLEKLANKHEAQLFRRHVIVNDRVKSENVSIIYNVDGIHNAIAENKKITFNYFEYNLEKEMVFRHNNKKYKVSPLALVWNDSNYYMVAYETETDLIKNYRVDRMKNVAVTAEKREGFEKFSREVEAHYTQKQFSMYSGKEQHVKLWFDKKMMGVVIDRFGKNVVILKDADENGFSISVNVEISPQFFGWLAGLGNNVKIVSPDSITAEYKKHLESILSNM